jgi:hypothetical protein
MQAYLILTGHEVLQRDADGTLKCLLEIQSQTSPTAQELRAVIANG